MKRWHGPEGTADLLWTVSQGVLMCLGAGSLLKGKSGGVMEKIAFKVNTGEGCVCRGVITLNSLVFGDGICAFVTRTSSMRFNLSERPSLSLLTT
eukprot:1155237-Pelagomonas_calceolata.AAC.1